MQGQRGGRGQAGCVNGRYVPNNAILFPYVLRNAPWEDQAMHDLFLRTVTDLRVFLLPGQQGSALSLPAAVLEQAQNVSHKLQRADLSLSTSSNTSATKWSNDLALHAEADEVLVACRRLSEVIAKEICKRYGQMQGNMQLNDMVNAIKREGHRNSPMLSLGECLDISRKWTNRGAHVSDPQDPSDPSDDFIEDNMAVACRYAVAILPQFMQVVPRGQVDGGTGSRSTMPQPRSRPSTPLRTQTPPAPPCNNITPSRQRNAATPQRCDNGSNSNNGGTLEQKRPGQQGASVKVKNLPPQLTHWRALFETFQAAVGNVVSVKVPPGHGFYGFVNFSSPEDAQRAVAVMDWKVFHGKTIQVGLQQQQQQQQQQVATSPRPSTSLQRTSSPLPSPPHPPSQPCPSFSFPNPPTLQHRAPEAMPPLTQQPRPARSPERMPGLHHQGPQPTHQPQQPRVHAPPTSASVPAPVLASAPAPAPVSPQPTSPSPLRPYPTVPPSVQPTEPLHPPSQPPTSVVPEPQPQEPQHQPGITASGVFRARPPSPPLAPPMILEEELRAPPPIQPPLNPLEQQPGESDAAYMARLHNVFNQPSPISDPHPTSAGASSRLGTGAHLPAATTAVRGDGGARIAPPAGQAAVPSSNSHTGTSTAAASPGAASSGGAAAAPPSPPPPLAAVHAQPAPAATSTPQGPQQSAICAICWGEPIEFGFTHGDSVHSCACCECASAIGVGGSCPICRQPVERVLRVFSVTSQDDCDDGPQAHPTRTASSPAPGHPAPGSSRPAAATAAAAPPDTAGVTTSLLGHARQVNGLAFNPQGTLLASASDDRSVRIWSVDFPGAQIAVLSHASRVTDVVFSPDGSKCVTASEDTKLRVWDAASFQPTGVVFTGHSSCVNTVAVANHRGTPVCVSGANGGSIMVWDLLTGQTRTSLVGHPSHVHCVAVSADGNTVVSSGFDKAVRVWDLARGSEKHALTGHTGAPCNVHAVACSPAAASTLCVSAGMDKSVRVWDFATGQAKHVIAGAHADWVRAVAISADGTTCYSTGSDRALKMW